MRRRRLAGRDGRGDRDLRARRSRRSSRPQIAAIRLEPFRQPFVFSHGSLFLVVFRQCSDERNPIFVTRRSTTMQARMKNPAMLVPDAMQALLALGASVKKAA